MSLACAHRWWSTGASSNSKRAPTSDAVKLRNFFVRDRYLVPLIVTFRLLRSAQMAFRRSMAPEIPVYFVLPCDTTEDVRIRSVEKKSPAVKDVKPIVPH